MTKILRDKPYIIAEIEDFNDAPGKSHLLRPLPLPLRPYAHNASCAP